MRVGKKDSVTPVLEVYLRTGTETFCFTWEDDAEEDGYLNALLDNYDLHYVK